MDRTRVLLVTTHLAVGGSEMQLLRLARGLDPERFEITVCSLMSGGSLVPAFRHLGLPVHELGVSAKLGELNGLRLAAVIARFRPHVVHGRLILASLWARLGRPFGARVICEERGLALDRPRAVTWIDRATRSFCDVLVVNSAAVATRVRARDAFPAERIRVIRPGIDVGAFRADGSDERPYDLITIARLETLKGVLDLPDVMQRILAVRPATTLAIAGDGSKADELRRAVEQRGLGPRVLLLGERRDVPDLLARARVFLLPSHEEGLSAAILEAMASGLPVVATDVGGTAEAVQNGVTGQLAPPRDADGLAAAALRYLSEPAMAEAHGVAGRERANRSFSIGRMIVEYAELYEELRRFTADRLRS
ncbi:MAG: glycosyltransferase [Elusimicrobia bacterium]|nr:glycosyltransferase [Elusimicrobiota bacterium]